MPTKTANEQFLDAMIRHQTYLLRYSGYVRNLINGILDKTEADLAEKILGRLANAPGGLNTPVEWRRLQTLVDQIATIRGRAWDKVDEVFEDQMTQLALAESVSLAGIVQLTLPVQIDVVQPSARLLRSIALARPFQGKLLREWVDGMEDEDIRRIHGAIQTGMTAGESMQQITSRVIGNRSLEGITQMTRQQVQAVVRTAVMHVSNHSRNAWFAENNDVVTQEYFVATLDSRTTPICRANDGKVFELGKGPLPPLHYQCRSLRIAHLDGVLAGDRPAKPFVERELVQEYADQNGMKGVRNRDDLPHGTKGDFDKWSRGRIRELVGPIPASTNYQQWLKQQSKAFQDDTMGVTKARLFRDGDLPLDRFVNRNGDELTLSELASTEKEAFRAAGLNPDDF